MPGTSSHTPEQPILLSSNFPSLPGRKTSLYGTKFMYIRQKNTQNSYKTLQRKKEQKPDKQWFKTKISKMIILDWQI